MLDAMIKALKNHWPEYLIEAGGLFLFLSIASLLAVLLEHPDSPVNQAVKDATLRHALLGLGMGTYIAALVYSPWGKKSGAHINPAVTWTFFRLGKIKFADAIFYTLAQFLGAIIAAQLMAVLLGELYKNPAINYNLTLPGADGMFVAFIAEFMISFLLMLVVLIAMNSKKLEPFVGAFTGLLIACYLAFELPYSGMSLNPARTFGSAFLARDWMGLWIYFTAPVLAMLLSAEVYRRFSKNQKLACAKLQHGKGACIFCDKEAPNFPVEEKDKKEINE